MWPHRDKVTGRRRLAMTITVLVVTGCSAAGTEPETTEPPAPTVSDEAGVAADPGREEDELAAPAAAEDGSPGTNGADDAAMMTIAQVLQNDERFTRFGEIAARTEATIGGNPTTWLGLWDLDADRLGDDREGVTVFVPTNDAFEALDPALLAVIDDPNVDDWLLRSLLGAHYVHRLYPSADFEPGPHRPFRGSVRVVELSLDPPAWGGHVIEHPDLRTANGYIHGISGVVIPDDITAAARTD